MNTELVPPSTFLLFNDVNEHPNFDAYNENHCAFLAEIRYNRFHDDLSPLDFPMITLHARAIKLGMDSIAENVKAGKYDATNADDDWIKRHR